MPRVLVALAVLALTIYAAVDCVQTEDDRVRGLPKLVWVVLILLFPPAGPIAWFIAGKQRVVGGKGHGPNRHRPQGPDDDPDFLRSI